MPGLRFQLFSLHCLRNSEIREGSAAYNTKVRLPRLHVERKDTNRLLQTSSFCVQSNVCATISISVVLYSYSNDGNRSKTFADL